MLDAIKEQTLTQVFFDILKQLIMPSMPKWVNNAVENLLSSKFRETTVIETEYISEDFKRVKFSANLHGLEYAVGYAVAFRVNETDYRNYTPYYFDKVNSCFEILFHLHGDAVGCAFAEALTENDRVKMLIPRGKEMFNLNYKFHIVIGDESSIGTALAIKAEAEKHDHTFNGIYELNKFQILETLELYGNHTNKNNSPQVVIQLASLVSDRAIIDDETAFYITGNGKTLQSARKFLKQSGFQSDQIITQAYWMEGKKGL